MRSQVISKLTRVCSVSSRIAHSFDGSTDRPTDPLFHPSVGRPTGGFVCSFVCPRLKTWSSSLVYRPKDRATDRVPLGGETTRHWGGSVKAEAVATTVGATVETGKQANRQRDFHDRATAAVVMLLES